jgi:hypothetical protein
VAYAEFRAGLRRHIGMEEKILLPAARSANEGEPLASAAKLPLYHGALAALLVPTPTGLIIVAIRTQIFLREDQCPLLGEEGVGTGVVGVDMRIDPDLDRRVGE